MHPKIFQKMKHLMETKFKRSLKYRDDFLSENYNQEIKCWDCSCTKNRRLFPYRKQYKDNKEKRCKKCVRTNNKLRRQNLSLEQKINRMVTSAKYSARKRAKLGRIECSEHTITVNDILNLKKKQNNKCIYTGQELGWSSQSRCKASIDRIDSSKGYTPDNIQLVSFISNQAKNSLSEKDFLIMIKQIYEYKQLGTFF